MSLTNKLTKLRLNITPQRNYTKKEKAVFGRLLTGYEQTEGGYRGDGGCVDCTACSEGCSEPDGSCTSCTN